jgi:hypothetical protein
MSNSLLTISMITNKALMILENNLSFTPTVNRSYDDQFAKSGAKIGNTVNARLPVQYTGGRTPTIALNSTVESYVPITLTTQYNIGVAFTSQDLTLSIDDFGDRILKPQVAQLSNMIDYDGLQLYKDIYQQVGTPGATPSSLETYNNAGVKLDNSAVPDDGLRYTCLNPAAQAKAVVAGQAFFNPNMDISDQYRKGFMGKYAGFEFAKDQNVGVQTIGTYAATNGTMTVTNAVSTGSTVVTGGWTSGDQLNKGDIVTFSGVYRVNPQNRQSTGQLQQFVVTADTGAASGGGALTLSLSPAVVFSGNYQNVTSTTGTIAAGATITVYGASATVSPQNMAYHRDAFVFATADLELPQGAVGGARKASKLSGISLRMQPFYDGINDLSYWRLDVLGGWKCVRPELACRVSG